MAKENLAAGIADELNKAKQAGDAALKEIIASWTDAVGQMNDIGSKMAGGLTEGLSNLASVGETVNGFLEPSVNLTQGLADVLEKGGGAAKSSVGGIQAFGGALNTAMGVVGIVTMAVTTLISIFQELTKADAAYQALADGADEFKTKCEETTIAQQQSLAVTQAQGPVAQGLVDKIKGLTDAQGNLTGSQSECAQAVAELNQMYPGLNLQLDASAGKLNMNTAELLSNVEGMQAMAEAEAMQSQYTKLVEQKVEAELNRKVALDKVREALVAQGLVTEEEAKKLDESTIATIAHDKALKGAGLSWGVLSGDTKAALDAYQDYDSALQDNQEHLGTLTPMIKEEALAQAASTQAKGEAASAVKNLTELEAAALIAKQENNQALSDEDANALEAWKTNNGERATVLEESIAREKDLYDARVDAATEMNDRINLANQTSLLAATDNLEANTEVVEQYTDNMDYLYGKIPESLRKNLEDAGTDQARLVAELRDDMENGGGEVAQRFIDAYTAALNAGKSESEAAAYALGTAVPDASSSGMAANDALLTASEQQVNDSIEKMSSMIGEDGPFYYLGMGIINRLVRGMRTLQDKLYSTTDSIMEGLKERMKITGSVSVVGSGLSSKATIKWYDKGGLFNFPQLIGIAERRPEFVGAAEDLESFIAKSVNNAFVRIDPALLHDIGSIGGVDTYGGDTVNFSPRVVINTQKLTDAELKRATDYVSREFARVLPGRKVGRIS